MTQDFRLVVGMRSAERTLRPQGLPKPRANAPIQGLRYENRVGVQLGRLVGEGYFARLEHNPWFRFHDTYGISLCSPDFLLHTNSGAIIIVEVKLTWVPVARHKLADLYCPVVGVATEEMVTPLIIVRNLTRDAPIPKFTLQDALNSDERLLHWPDTGKILWQ